MLNTIIITITVLLGCGHHALFPRHTDMSQHVFEARLGLALSSVEGGRCNHEATRARSHARGGSQGALQRRVGVTHC